jgi:N6-adenosine-specific RNA methylase IME4
MKFNVIVSDPPWDFHDSLFMSDVKRGAKANYNTLTVSQIADIPVKNLISDEGTLLALWVPSSLLQQGLDVMKAWGFTHKQTYVWVKIKKHTFLDFKKWIVKSILKHQQIVYDKFAYVRAINAIIESLDNIDLNDFRCFGMGRLFRQTHEICLIGISSNKIYKLLKNKSQRSVSFAENLKHSAKPEDLQDSLDAMFPEDNNAKLELFSRRQRKGWWCLGNEAPMTKNEDILVSLNKLNLSDPEYLIPINKVISCYDGEKDKELFKMWNGISSNERVF